MLIPQVAISGDANKGCNFNMAVIKMFQLVKDKNRMVVTQKMTSIETFARALCTIIVTMVILKLHPLFIHICICRFKNDLFLCVPEYNLPVIYAILNQACQENLKIKLT